MFDRRKTLPPAPEVNRGAGLQHKGQVAAVIADVHECFGHLVWALVLTPPAGMSGQQRGKPPVTLAFTTGTAPVEGTRLGNLVRGTQPRYPDPRSWDPGSLVGKQVQVVCSAWLGGILGPQDWEIARVIEYTAPPSEAELARRREEALREQRAEYRRRQQRREREKALLLDRGLSLSEAERELDRKIPLGPPPQGLELVSA